MYEIDKVRGLPKLVCVFVNTLGKYQFLLQFLVFFSSTMSKHGIRM